MIKSLASIQAYPRGPEGDPLPLEKFSLALENYKLRLPQCILCPPPSPILSTLCDYRPASIDALFVSLSVNAIISMS